MTNMLNSYPKLWECFNFITKKLKKSCKALSLTNPMLKNKIKRRIDKSMRLG